MTSQVSIASGEVLKITTQPDSGLDVNRLSNLVAGEIVDGGPDYDVINVAPNTAIEIGPFNTSRRYDIGAEFGNTEITKEVSSRKYNKNASGIYLGGGLTINQSDTTKFDIAAGRGVIVNNYTYPDESGINTVDWQDITGTTAEFIATDFTSYVAIDAGGNVVQFAGGISASARRSYIIIGLLVHTGPTNVEGVTQFGLPAYDIGGTMHDLSAVIGLINITDNVFSADSTNLEIAKSAGEAFKLGGNFQTSRKSPNIVQSPALSTPDLFKPYRDGSGDGFKIDFPLNTTIDPSKYDDNSGTLANSGNSWQIVRIFLDPENDDVIAQYGQFLYVSKSVALAAINFEDFEVNPVLKDALLRCFLLVKGNATDLSDSARALFIAADKFGQVPAQGATQPLLSGAMELDSSAYSSDFTADVGIVQMIDNSSNAITVTLPDNTGNMMGASTEFWVTTTTSTYNVIFETPDHTYKLNGVSGVDPDAVKATLNSSTPAYLKVLVRYCNTGEYLIDQWDTIAI